jgi:capsular exopolysaccharide synthesis family protein
VVYTVYLVLSLLDNSISGENTIKENFKQPVLGNIPTWYTKAELESGAKRRTGDLDAEKNTYTDKLLNTDTTFYITEAFNTLRTNVIYANAATKNPVLVVTGDVAGVGKSVVSTNLALSIANLQKKVLLIGCDMRCPSLFKIFGTNTENGLSELLAGIVEKSEDVVYKYGETGLDVIFSGKIPPNPSELLSGYRMKELVEEWKKSYDYIILDMPPLVNITDAAVVSSLVSGYIVTTRCNSSNVRDVNVAVEHIKAAKGSVMGFVVNDVNPKNTVGYGGKYGKYGKYAKYAKYGKYAK